MGGLALLTPQVLAAGHGALRLDWPLALPVRTLGFLILLKLTASMVSLGSGFRGGLFFASLFVGSLVGKLYGVGLERLMPGFGLDVTACMLAGMGTFAVAIVGGPLTMSFLVLETTATSWSCWTPHNATWACSPPPKPFPPASTSRRRGRRSPNWRGSAAPRCCPR